MTVMFPFICIISIKVTLSEILIFLCHFAFVDSQIEQNLKLILDYFLKLKKARFGKEIFSINFFEVIHLFMIVRI